MGHIFFTLCCRGYVKGNVRRLILLLDLLASFQVVACLDHLMTFPRLFHASLKLTRNEFANFTRGCVFDIVRRIDQHSQEEEDAE